MKKQALLVFNDFHLLIDREEMAFHEADGCYVWELPCPKATSAKGAYMWDYGGEAYIHFRCVVETYRVDIYVGELVLAQNN